MKLMRMRGARVTYSVASNKTVRDSTRTMGREVRGGGGTIQLARELGGETAADRKSSLIIYLLALLENLKVHVPAAESVVRPAGSMN